MRRPKVSRSALLGRLILSTMSERATICAACVAMQIDPDCDIGFTREHVVGWMCDPPELVVWDDNGWKLRKAA